MAEGARPSKRRALDPNELTSTIAAMTQPYVRVDSLNAAYYVVQTCPAGVIAYLQGLFSAPEPPQTGPIQVRLTPWVMEDYEIAPWKKKKPWPVRNQRQLELMLGAPGLRERPCTFLVFWRGDTCDVPYAKLWEDHEKKGWLTVPLGFREYCCCVNQFAREREMSFVHMFKYGADAKEVSEVVFELFKGKAE